MWQICGKSENRFDGRDLRLAQLQRNCEDTLDLKALEYKDVMDKYLRMEADVSTR